MLYLKSLFLAGVPGLALMASAMFDGSAQRPDSTLFTQKVHPALDRYCLPCHGPKTAQGGVDFARWTGIDAVARDQSTLRKAVKQLHDGTMPPAGAPALPEADREHMLTWLRGTLGSRDDSQASPDPGRVLIHRLSRYEYNCTLRDLLGITSRPADSFPADGGGGGGFDNNADTLFIPPVLMERLLDAAGQAVDEARVARLCPVLPGNGVTKQEAGRRNITTFLAKAFRRPARPDEVVRYLKLFEASLVRGETFQAAMKATCKAALVSPNFLFRVERDQNTSAPYPAGDYELASRLSYFLWSSMPDDELFRLASQHKLTDPNVLAAQTRRMLLDSRAKALGENFAGQWLRVRELYSSAQPDPKRFPQYTTSLRDAMSGEVTRFCNSIFQSNESLLTLLDGNYTFVNEELAKHYGMSGVAGAALQRVKLEDGRRGGLLGMAGILTLTSYPQRTSPVLRGKWVLEELLGAPVPPPPPNSGGLPASDAPLNNLSFRQRLEKHRDRPECASCHARMDPLGFGLENYDAIGRWREEIGGKLVDSSGVLATGEKFTGPVELRALLLKQKDEFLRNLTDKLLSYALGRGLEPYDQPAVRKITKAVAADGYRSFALFREIVLSYPFRYRRNG